MFCLILINVFHLFVSHQLFIFLITHKYCLTCPPPPPPVDTEDVVSSLDIDWDTFYENSQNCDDDMDGVEVDTYDDDNGKNDSDDDDV